MEITSTNILNIEMNSNNINKIMRKNLNLNPNILSKNTTEILNTCIGKLYKQMPLTFKHSLHSGKLIGTAKSEVPTSKERFKMQDRQRINALKHIKANTSIFEGQRLNARMAVSQIPNTSMAKKLIKSPGFKIYNCKRYCSSRSSSSGSALYRNDNRNRFARAYHTRSDRNLEKPTTQISFVKPLKDFSSSLPLRNQYMSENVSSWHQAVEVSSQIREGLMYVDKEIKNRLKISTATPSNATTRKLCVPPNETNKSSRLLTSSRSGLKVKSSKRPLKHEEINFENSVASDAQSFRTSKKLMRSSLVKPPSSNQMKKQALETIKPKIIPLFETSYKDCTSTTDCQINSSNLRENKSKSNPKKRRTTLRNCVPPEENKMKESTDSRHFKEFQVNGKTTPSATYCLANPWNFNHI